MNEGAYPLELPCVAMLRFYVRRPPAGEDKLKDNEKGSPGGTPLLVRHLVRDYSAGAIAPIGQASAQVPQSMHTFGSME